MQRATTMLGICKDSINICSSPSVDALFQRTIPSPLAGKRDPHMVIYMTWKWISGTNVGLQNFNVSYGITGQCT